MIKRIAAASLWFISMGYAYVLVAYFLGLPASGGLVIGALAAAFVVMDPTGMFWGTRKRSATESNRPDSLGLTAPTR